MSGESNNSDKLLIETFAKGFEETKTITRNLQNENQANAIALTGLRTEVNTIHQNVDWLVKTVRDDGDNKSVMARLLMLENDTKDLTEWLESEKKKEESKVKTLDTLNSEEHKGRWQLRIALATGSLGFIATIITTLLSYYFKK